MNVKFQIKEQEARSEEQEEGCRNSPLPQKVRKKLRRRRALGGVRTARAASP